MNKFFPKLLLVTTFIAILLVIILAKIPSHFDNNEIADLQIVVATKPEYLTQADIDAVKEEAERAIKFIPQILSVKPKRAIKINIVDEGICNENAGIVSLPILHVREKRAVIIHELTHIIAKHENNSFFSEGLAVYFQEKYGNFKGFPNFSIPLDDFLRNHKEQIIPLPILKDANEIFTQVGTDKRRLAYIEAGSFINFLVVTYGAQRLAELHKSSSLTYKKIYGKSFEELATDWEKFVLEESY